MDYKSFLKRITTDVAYLNPDMIEYINYHSRRYYFTYVECAKYLKKGDKILSVGGFSSIEKILAEDIGVEVTILDFPDAVQEWKTYYDFLGFQIIAADLSKDDLNMTKGYYNMLIFSEVVEHVTKSIYDQMMVFEPFTANGGHAVITTPNLGSIMQIVQLLLMKPILQPAELTFGPATVENIGVHKREYMPSEIVDAFSRMKYKHVTTKFFFYTYPKTIAMKFIYFIGSIVPRFKVGMLVIGQKN